MGGALRASVPIERILRPDVCRLSRSLPDTPEDIVQAHVEQRPLDLIEEVRSRGVNAVPRQLSFEPSPTPIDPVAVSIAPLRSQQPG